MSLPSPLRALAVADPVRARARVIDALTVEMGHRGRAAARLAGAEWLPAPPLAYPALQRCIVALGMGDEVRARWPRPQDPRPRVGAE